MAKLCWQKGTNKLNIFLHILVYKNNDNDNDNDNDSNGGFCFVSLRKFVHSVVA